MFANLFQGLFDTDMTSVIAISDFLLCVGSALVVGLILAAFYMYQTRYTKSFVATLALLPAVVCVVIMMVNGNLGTGVAVVGAFSLVRFRSVPGSSREITFIFFAMSIGLAIGMGFVSFAFFMSLLISIFSIALQKIPLLKPSTQFKELKIVIPEDLDYTEVFTDILATYTKKQELIRVKTMQLGSMIELLYEIELKDSMMEKEMIDAIRVRNGNLSVICARRQVNVDEL